MLMLKRVYFLLLISAGCVTAVAHIAHTGRLVLTVADVCVHIGHVLMVLPYNDEYALIGHALANT